MAHNSILRLFILFQILLLPFGEAAKGGFWRAIYGEGGEAGQTTTAVYTWWLSDWASGQMVCELKINHAGSPTGVDIYTHCGQGYYNTWLNTPPCHAAASGGDISTCSGVYLRYVSKTFTDSNQLANQGESIDIAGLPLYGLPPPQAWLDIEGCEFRFQSYHCSQTPFLIIKAEELLPTEQILRIEGQLNGVPFTCQGSECKVELPPTEPLGVQMGFYAISSSGMSSPPYLAQLRAIQLGDGDTRTWQVNALSDRWRGQSLSSCEQIWQIFPPLGSLPGWLNSPQDAAALASDVPYTYLAGQLITKGVVNANECARLGLQGSGYANPCGLEKARAEVDTWQDRFDPQIIAAASTIGIPAQLLKNLIAQESQFWPGSYYLSPEERGLGQLTPEGADTLLLWDHASFADQCPRVLHPDTCRKGYPALTEEQQTFVQGAVMQTVNADCPLCFMGIDLSKAGLSIEVFAKVLKANCQQMGQTIINLRGIPPGVASSYEDLWRFTLVNYHAGAGCLTNAITALPLEEPLIWDNLAPFLDTDCPGISEYVGKVTRTIE